MIFKELDTVAIARDLPELGVSEGMQAAVLLVFTEPSLAYEVEVIDDDFETVYLGPVSPDMIRSTAESTEEE